MAFGREIPTDLSSSIVNVRTVFGWIFLIFDSNRAKIVDAALPESC